MLALLLLLLFPQTVVRHLRYSMVEEAPRAYQPADMTSPQGGPYFVLLGENQMFCAVTGNEYASVLDGERFDCRWQMPRN